MSTLVAVAALTAVVGALAPVQLGVHSVTAASQGRPKVIVAERAQPGAAMIVEFAVGAMDDGQQAGLTRLAQFVLLDANRRWPSAGRVRALYVADAQLVAATRQSRARFVLEGIAPEFNAVAERLLKQLLAPQLDPEELDKARHRMKHHDGGAAASDLAAVLAMAARPSYGFSSQPQGERGILSDITFEQVQAHIKKHFRPANATVTITGGADHARLLRVARSYRGGDRRPQVRQLQSIVGRYQSWSPFNYRLVGLSAPLGTAEQAAEMRLLTLILGERVQHHFRSAGTSYATSATPVRRPWASLVLVEVPTLGMSAGKVSKDLEKLLKQTTDEKTLTKDDFEKVRIQLLHRLRQIDESPIALAHQLAMNGAGDPWYGPEVLKAVETISVETFRSHVRPWTSPDRAAHVVLSPSLSRSL